MPVGERDALGNEAAFSDPGLPYHTNDAPIAPGCFLESCGQCVHFTITTDQGRLETFGPPPVKNHGDEAARRYSFQGAFDVHHLLFAELGSEPDESGGGLGEHHTPGRRYRLHPLGHAYTFTDSSVTGWTGTDLTDNNLTRVEPDPQLQGNPIASLDIGAEALCVGLNLQRGEACA
jgi:hypothetical protein